jgi:NAD(P)-dependent dehydrogenase (short-subunit alcohol dehydrogenase family)
MQKRTFVVTGGNTGVGKAIAVDLARRKYHVVIISRDPGKGAAALQEIRGVSGNQSVDLIVGDLSSIQSTKDLAKNILKACPDLSVLVNNAGIWPMRLEINRDGLEAAFMVNHMAPFILCNMLLGRLKRNAPSRIVNVNAGLYVFGKLDIEKTPYGKDFGRLSTYMNTKLCNIYFTQSFSEMLRGSVVTINAVHPGVLRTNLGDTPGIFGGLLKMFKRAWDPPEEGAKAPVWLATCNELREASGKYFELCVEKPYARNARDPELRKRLWELSARLAAL